MKALVYHGPKDLSIEDLPDPMIELGGFFFSRSWPQAFVERICVSTTVHSKMFQELGVDVVNNPHKTNLLKKDFVDAAGKCADVIITATPVCSPGTVFRISGSWMSYLHIWKSSLRKTIYMFQFESCFSEGT